MPHAGYHGASLTDGETEAQVVPTLLKATGSVGNRAVLLSQSFSELCSIGSSGFRGKLRCSHSRGSSRASNSQGVVTERRARPPWALGVCQDLLPLSWAPCHLTQASVSAGRARQGPAVLKWPILLSSSGDPPSPSYPHHPV